MHLIDKVDPAVMFEAEWPSFSASLQASVVMERYIERYARMPSIGFAEGDRCVGGVLMDDGFIHVSVLPEFYGKFSLVYLPALEWALAQADPIYAMFDQDNQRCLRFTQHSGWEKIGAYGGVLFYRSTGMLLQRLRARRARHGTLGESRATHVQQQDLIHSDTRGV